MDSGLSLREPRNDKGYNTSYRLGAVIPVLAAPGASFSDAQLLFRDGPWKRPGIHFCRALPWSLFRDAPLGAGPKPISPDSPCGRMDSGLSLREPPNDRW